MMKPVRASDTLPADLVPSIMKESMASTVVLSNLDYLRIDRDTEALQVRRKKPLQKYNAADYFYLAAYHTESLINSDHMRAALYEINSRNKERANEVIDFSDRRPNAKYFVFPEEVNLAHLHCYTLRMSGGQNSQINIEYAGTGLPREERPVCFVKLYLFERSFVPSLREYLAAKNMTIETLQTKCSGLDVMAPVARNQAKRGRNHVEYHSEETVEQVY